MKKILLLCLLTPLFLQIKNDTLTQIWPVDKAGEPMKSHYYMEKWVRFE